MLHPTASSVLWHRSACPDAVRLDPAPQRGERGTPPCQRPPETCLTVMAPARDAIGVAVAWLFT